MPQAWVRPPGSTGLLPKVTGKVVSLRRRRQYRVARSGMALLVSGAVVPTVLGSAVIAT